MSKELKITRAEVINASNIIKDFCAKVEDCNDDCPFSIVNPHGTWECGLMKDPSRWRFERFSESEKKYAEALAIIGDEAVTRLNGKLYCIFGDDNKIGIKTDVFPNIEENEIAEISKILVSDEYKNSSIFQN